MRNELQNEFLEFKGKGVLLQKKKIKILNFFCFKIIGLLLHFELYRMSKKYRT